MFALVSYFVSQMLKKTTKGLKIAGKSKIW